ncbi:hypothetical protein EVAR_66753_1 [Eumeta japonica]|uniref:Uncharacterized protein n=1 Tax=Eumeta variegata TaxID=151549 RepID=A0A4C1Z7A9_EUMVA|nr:hypothetical protein EVAR_66753_1 [Eumeta japonica]
MAKELVAKVLTVSPGSLALRAKFPFDISTGYKKVPARSTPALYGHAPSPHTFPARPSRPARTQRARNAGPLSNPTDVASHSDRFSVIS